ncbi:MAG TPA: hypothetical protein VIL37_16950 [Natronosporangium sp.]
MPLINVIRGEPVPDALLNIRTPYLRVPVWLVVTWWCLRRLALAVVLACRHWYLTGPAVLLTWLWWRFGWPGPAGAGAAVAVTAGGWWLADPNSFDRWAAIRH